ncbi:MAG: class I SAM-dependent RNA methyltransferase [Chloroflexia bacterium]|nr:class I SAM-dependent RNA methyltransferase [Chloroflexia bacterium]
MTDKVLPGVGTEIEVTVERIVPGGAGLARHGGLVVLVERGAPGDVVRVRIDRTKGQAAFASIAAIVTPSPDRIPDAHPAIARAGADLQHLTYEAELTAKRGIVEDSLRRIAGVEDMPAIETVPSPEIWQYRSVVEWQVDLGRREIGQRLRGSHQVVDLEHDPLVVPALDEVLGGLRAKLRRNDVVAPAGVVRAIAGDTAVDFIPPPPGESRTVLTHTILGTPFRLDARCFLQVNRPAMPNLVHRALSGWPAEEGPVFDLYGGIGLFATLSGREARDIVVVESHAPSATYARENLDAAGMTRARVRPVAVETFLHGWDKRRRPAVVLLDPPRAGLGAGVVGHLLRLRPRRLVYVSCDPATLARDLRPLLASGFEIERCSVVDMFPRTHHVETVVHLTTGDDAGGTSVETDSA